MVNYQDDIISTAAYYNRKKISIRFDVTNKCNLRCTHCYQGENNSYDVNSEINSDDIMYFLDSKLKDTHRKNKCSFTFSGGEIFIVKNITKVFQYIKKEFKNASVSVLSNGEFFREVEKNISYIDYFQFSLDGLTPQIHENRRVGSNFSNLLKSIEIVKINKKG